MINVPRSDAGAKSIRYSGTAPLFATMADVFQYPLQEARNSCRNVEKENQQFRSRWSIVLFRNAIPEPDRNNTLDACAKCAAIWYLEAARADDVSPAAVASSFSAPCAESRGHKRANMAARI